MTDLNYTKMNRVNLIERAKDGDQWARGELGRRDLTMPQVVKLIEKCTDLTLLGASDSDIVAIGKYLSMGNAVKLENWEMLALRKWVQK